MKPFFFEQGKNQSGLQDLTVRLKILAVPTKGTFRLNILVRYFKERKMIVAKTVFNLKQTIQDTCTNSGLAVRKKYELQFSLTLMGMTYFSCDCVWQ